MNLFGKGLWARLATIYTLKCTFGMVPKRSLIEISNGDARPLHQLVEDNAFEDREDFLQLSASPSKTKKYALRGENDLHIGPTLSLSTSDANKRSYEEAFGMGINQAPTREQNLKKNNLEVQLYRTRPYFVHPDSPKRWSLGLNYDRDKDELPPETETRDFFDQTFIQKTGEISFMGPEISGPSTSLKGPMKPGYDRQAYFYFDELNGNTRGREFQGPSTVLTLGNNKSNLSPANVQHPSLIIEDSNLIPSNLLTIGSNKPSLIPNQRKASSFNLDEINISKPLKQSGQISSTTPVRRGKDSVTEHELPLQMISLQLKKYKTAAEIPSSSQSNYNLKINPEKNNYNELKVSLRAESTSQLSSDSSKFKINSYGSMKGKEKKKTSISEVIRFEENIENNQTVMKIKSKVKNRINENEWETKIQNIFWNHIFNVMERVESEDSSTFSAFKNIAFLKSIEETLDKMKNVLEELKPRFELHKKKIAFTEENSKKKYIKLFKELLDQKNNQIKGSIFDDLAILAQEDPNKNFRNSAKSLFKTLKSHIEVNECETFYITNQQAFNFLKSEFENVEPRIYCLSTEITYRCYYLATSIVGKVKKALNKIPLGDIFTADEKFSKIENLGVFMGYNQLAKFCEPYSTILRYKISIRNLFMTYSTLINKIFREGPMEDSELIFKKQKVAIEFFDSIWSSEFLEFDDESKILYLKPEHLPLPKERRSTFLETYQIQRLKNNPPEIFAITVINWFNPSISTECWRFIALWLAKYRYDLYSDLFAKNKHVTRNFKNLITSIAYCLANLSIKD
ncbi:hypothetical protein BY996DRAFT_6417327 [Phakopsora pachyrhizi]|nr:hypothetical protein BY996DRAFT_6417327 [Phakopsora pachyrhizi]